MTSSDRQHTCARRLGLSRIRACALAMIAMAALVLAFAGRAAAASPSCVGVGGGMVTCTFTSVGQTAFDVPAGATSLTAAAVGQQGGADFGTDTPGGLGAVATGTLAVTGGEHLFVDVDVLGGTPGRLNGFFVDAGAGGGESDVRTCSTSSGCTATAALNSRLLVAGGGGGRGDFGGAPGNAGTPSPGGNGAAGVDVQGAPVASAQGATDVAAGTGATGSGADDGSFGTGGNAVSTTGADGESGGGGGAGWFGGGGGESLPLAEDDGGSGGGGSSFAAPGVTGPTFTSAAAGKAPEVTLTLAGTAATITSPVSATFNVGTAGGFTVDTSGFPTPAITEKGTLPQGVTFTDNGDGTAGLSGTPATGTGGPYPITITATNGIGQPTTQSFTLTVDQGAAITSADQATFTVGQPGSFTFTTTGFPFPVVADPQIPVQGLSFTDNQDGTATLSGTPAAGTSGTYFFPVVVTNTINGQTDTARQDFELIVDQAPAITSADHATFTAGQSGSFTVTTSALPGPALKASGTLPAGVTFTDNGDGTATITGTPEAGTGGTYPITNAATNGIAPDASQDFTLTVDQAPTITSGADATFTAGHAGSFTVTTTGFPAPGLTEAGDLPTGLVFHDNGDGTATISGTPAAGTGAISTITLGAANGTDPADAQTLTLTVDEAPSITTADHATFAAGQPESFTIKTTGFPAKTALGETGALPSGVTFIDNGDGTATLAGTPAAGTGGTHPLTLSAGNGVDPAATQAFTLTVQDAPSASITAPADGATVTIGTAVATTFSCADGAGAPGVATCTDGAGATSATGGVLNTTQVGAHTYTVTATSRDGLSATQSITYTVAPAPVVTAPAPPVTTQPPAPPAPHAPPTPPVHHRVVKPAAPTITITSPRDGARLIAGSTVTAGYACSGPGVASCHGPVRNGAAISTEAPGQHTFTVTASNHAGGRATSTVHYNVVAPTLSVSLGTHGVLRTARAAIAVACRLSAGPATGCAVRLTAGGVTIASGTGHSTVMLHLSRTGRRRLAGSLHPLRVTAHATAHATAQLGAAHLHAAAGGTLALARQSITTPNRAFMGNGATLSPGAARRLARLAGQIGDATEIRCVGFTANLGLGVTPQALALGLARARAVCATLRHDGVHARYRTSSQGTRDPLASNYTPQGQSLNRRVVIRIIRS
jgi:outer membrane protein OmpA-like peptidoglycan-associated protein